MNSRLTKNTVRLVIWSIISFTMVLNSDGAKESSETEALVEEFVPIGKETAATPTAMSATSSEGAVLPNPGDGKPIDGQSVFTLPGTGAVGAGGAYSFTYPMPGAPGRANLSGTAGLSYNSAHLRDSSLAGYGWDVPMQAITRSSRFGVDQLYTTNSFFSAPGVGELILVDNSTVVKEYRARIEGGFIRWFYDTTSTNWYSYDRNGVKTIYGISEGARIFDTNDISRVYAWYVEKIEDVYGNNIKFSYWKDEGTVYPKEILYTGYNGGNGLNSTRFQPFYDGPSSARTDITSSYSCGFKTVQRYRLDAVESYAADQLVSRYELSYTNGSTGVRSLLSSVTHIGTDGTNAMPASTFEYHQPDSNSIVKLSSDYQLPEGLHLRMFQPGASYEVPGDSGVRFADINGDSLPDLLYANGCTNENNRGIWLNTGSGWKKTTEWALPADTNLCFVGYIDRDQTPDSTGVVLMDVNGDGKADILMAQSYMDTNSNNWVERRHTWINNGSSGWDESSVWSIPTNVAFLGSYYCEHQWPIPQAAEYRLMDMNVQMPDLNGDGLPDLVYAVTNGGGSFSGGHLPKTNLTYLNTGNGWQATDNWSLPEGHYLLADLAFDWFWFPPPSSGTETMVLIAANSDVADNSIPDDGALRFVDLNGDGLSDLLYANGHCYGYDGISDSFGYTKKAWINTGSGWARNDNWALPAYNINVFYPGDITYDEYGNEFYSTGWSESHDFMYFHLMEPEVAMAFGECPPMSMGIMFQDVNGDGRPDIIFSHQYEHAYDNQGNINYSAVWLNNGNGWTRNDRYIPEMLMNDSFVETYYSSSSGNNSYFNTGILLQDLNGDGILDCMYDGINPDTGSEYKRMVSSGVDGRELMISHRTSFGGTRKIAYKSAAQTPDFKSPSNFLIVDTVVTEDGFGMSYTSRYDYADGWFYKDYWKYRRDQFRGFGQRSVVNAAGVKTVSYYHQGGGVNGAARGEYQDDYEAKSGRPYREEIYGSDGKLYASTITKWDIATYHDGSETRYWAKKALETSFSFASSGAHRETAVESVYNDVTGLTEEMHTLGRVTAHPWTGAVIDSFAGSNDELYVFTRYKNFSGTPYRYIISKPESIEVTSDSTGKNRLGRTEYTYFDDASARMISRWLDTTGQMVKEQEILSYDDYGNPEQTENAAGLVTAITYDSTYHTYPVTVSAAGQTTHMTSDPRSGKTLTVTDPAGGVSSNTYDVFFRPLKTWKDGIWREEYDYHIGWRDPILPETGPRPDNHVYVKINTGDDIPGDAEKILYADGLGRTIQTRSESERDDGVYRVQTTVYDEEGRITYAYEPRFSAGLGYIPVNPMLLNDSVVKYSYDALGRVTRVTPRTGDTGSPTAPATTVYEEGNNPWAVVATDALGIVHKTYNDAYGRVIKVQDFPDGPGAAAVETRYEFDLLGRLVKTIDPQNNQIIVAYDSLGRKTQMTDPDMGLWKYAYDTAGRLTNQLDAISNRIVFAYDTLSRVQTQLVYNASGALADTVVHTYDSSDDGNFTVYQGQLYRTVQNGVTNRYSYDDHGNILKVEAVLADIGTYVTTNSYDELDRPLSVGYPNGEAAVQYTFGAIGNLKGVASLYGAGDDGMDFYHVGEFNELGQIQDVTYGNGLESRFLYYSRSRRLRQSATRRVNGKAYQQLNYTYNAGGLITAIKDNLRTGEQSSTYDNIQYDGLNRLKSVAYGDNASPTTYGYDTLGNILNNGEYTNLTYQYSGTAPHAVTAIGDETFDYDANGNITNALGRELTFDAYNRLVKVTMDSGTEVRFRYLASGARYLKETVTGGQTNRTVYIGEGYEENRYATGQTNKLCHVFFAGKRVCSFAPIPEGRQIADATPSSRSGQPAKVAAASLPLGQRLESSSTKNWTRIYARNGIFLRYVSRLAPKTLVDRLAPVVALIAVILLFTVLFQENRPVRRFKVKGVVGYGRGKAIGFSPQASGWEKILPPAALEELRGAPRGKKLLKYFTLTLSAVCSSELRERVVKNLSLRSSCRAVLQRRRMRLFAAENPLQRRGARRAGWVKAFSLEEYRFHLSSFIPHLSAKKVLCTFFALSFFFTPCFAQGSFARGDVNGDGFVDIADALLIQQVVDGKREQDSVVFHAGFANGDVNYDGAVNATDARIIMEYATGLRDSLPVAPESDQTFIYYHADHLGSSNIVTDRSGEIVQHIEYTPYGETRHETNLGVSVNRLYTGQELDKETGLYYYNARYYDSKIGRFISPDTLIPDASDSQQFNRYSYVLNNPVMHTDPTGHMTEEERQRSEAHKQEEAEREAERYRDYALTDGNLEAIYDSFDGNMDQTLEWLYNQGVFNGQELSDVKGNYATLESAFEKLKEAGAELSPEMAALSALVGISKESLGNAESFKTLTEQAVAQIEKVAVKINEINQNLQKELEENNKSQKYWATGLDVHLSSVHPLPKDGRGLIGGLNYMEKGLTGKNGPSGVYAYSGNKGNGLDVGGAAQAIFAYGKGSWQGDFESYTLSLGIYTVSYFWSADWNGLSVGYGLGMPGFARETTTYTLIGGKDFE
jgi:RHS repeat-associated protein